MKKIWLLGFWAGVWLSFGVSAGSFDVDGISVSAEAETAAAARTQALQAGQEEAFARLTALLVAPAHRSAELSPETADVLNMVQDVSVRDEKTTATRYMASVNVRFDAEAVQRFFADRHVPYLSEMPPQSVVVPVFTSFAGQTAVFDEANPLYEAFKNLPTHGGLYRLTVPLGDAEDMAGAAGVTDAATQAAFLDTMLKKYRTKQALIVTMTPEGDGYFVQAHIYPEQGDEATKTGFHTAALPTQAQSADAAVAHLMTQLEEQWRVAKTNRFETPEEFTLVMPVDTLAQWHARYRQLKALDFLTRVEIRALRGNQAVVLLGFKGGETALLRRLRQRGLAVEAVNGVLTFGPIAAPVIGQADFETEAAHVQ